MRILADENIPLVDEFFGSLGSIQRVAGRTLSTDQLKDIDVLLVRSVTSVNQGLLAGTPVRFVGTCTIGTDHLDLDYLQQAGIPWASAPGCNARGVVDYVLGSLLTLSERTGQPLSARTYGILGAGQVGGRLAKVLKGLGWPVLVCDPIRQAQEPEGDFVALERLLAECDVISLHTPLTRQGDHPTWHLFNRPRLQGLRPDTWLINASRGPVIDNTALCDLLQHQRADLQVVLDVWEHEPHINRDLAERVQIATPHIAGYSLEGKLRGTAQIYQAFCAQNALEPKVKLDDLIPAPAVQRIDFGAQVTADELLTTLCRVVYDPRRDDADFRRALLKVDSCEQPARFDALRKHYPVRREIDGLYASFEHEKPELKRVLDALGVHLCQTAAASPKP